MGGLPIVFGPVGRGDDSANNIASTQATAVGRFVVAQLITRPSNARFVEENVRVGIRISGKKIAEGICKEVEEGQGKNPFKQNKRGKSNRGKRHR